MAKSKARRNLIIVASLFVITGALVMLAPIAPSILPPESPEISRVRLSKTENAFFMLYDAAVALPPVGGRPETGADFVQGPKAVLLDVFLKEDAPEIAAAIEASRPAVDVVHKALEMPHLFVPIDWQKLKNQPLNVSAYKLFDLPLRTFLLAVQDARAGSTDAAIATLVDSYRLRWRCTDELSTSTYFSPPNVIVSRCQLLKECPQEFLRRLLPALLELRSKWQPPAHAFDESLRHCEAIRKGYVASSSGHAPLLWRIGSAYNTARYRPVLSANLQELRKVSTYSAKEFLDWEKQNPDLAHAAWCGEQEPLLNNICLANSAYLLDLEGTCAVLALELYKADNGAYPGSLEAIVPKYMPKPPADPFSGNPLVYRREGAEYTLYSVGRDGVDNHCPRYHSADIAVHMPPE